MIVAMVAMRMVQAAIDEVIDVVAVRHRLVAAAGTVLVAFAADFRGAANGVVGSDRDDVLVDVIAVREFEVTVVEIVDVVAMADRHMAAVRAMLMGLAGVGGTGHPGLLFDAPRKCKPWLTVAAPRGRLMSLYRSEPNMVQTPADSPARHPRMPSSELDC
jgi:hypothetical protein